MTIQLTPAKRPSAEPEPAPTKAPKLSAAPVADTSCLPRPLVHHTVNRSPRTFPAPSFHGMPGWSFLDGCVVSLSTSGTTIHRISHPITISNDNPLPNPAATGLATRVPPPPAAIGCYCPATLANCLVSNPATSLTQTMTLTTTFGSIPTFQSADFYRADASVLLNDFERMWTVLCENDSEEETDSDEPSEGDSSQASGADTSVTVDSAAMADSYPIYTAITAADADASIASAVHHLDHLGAAADNGVHIVGDDSGYLGVDGGHDVFLDDDVSEEDEGYDEHEELLEYLLPTMYEDDGRASKITLHTYLLSGRVFAAFAGLYSTPCGGRSSTLVAKIHRPTTHDASHLYEAAAEATVYGLLPEGIAPRFHGLYVRPDGERMVASVLEHAGKPIGTVKAARALSRPDKNAILSLYHSLHAAGIVHVSCSPKHWLRAGAEYRLIDFGCRWVRGDVPRGRALSDDAFASQTDIEMAKVCRTLGLHL